MLRQNNKYIDGLVQDCSNSSALAIELLQPCTKPYIYISLSYFAWKRIRYLFSFHNP